MSNGSRDFVLLQASSEPRQRREASKGVLLVTSIVEN